MRVYALSGESIMRALFPPRKYTPKMEFRTMSRRHIAYAVLVVASFVISACSAPTAPTREDTTGECRGGFQVGTGRACES